MSLTLSVVEPHHSGIGGGCFSLLYDAKTGKTEGIDGRGIAPAKATADLFIKDGEVFHQIFRGGLSNEELYAKISDTLTVLTTGGDKVND